MRTRRLQMMCLLLARSRCSINTVSWMRRPCTGWFLRLVPRGHIPPRESWNTSKEWDQLQYFGHLKWRANSLEKILILGEIEGRGRRGRQRMSWLDSISDSIDMNLSTRQEIVKVRGTWRAAVHRVTKSQTRLSDWTELIREVKFINLYSYQKGWILPLFSPFYPQNLIQVFTKSTFNKYLLTEVLQILKIIYIWN